LTQSTAHLQLTGAMGRGKTTSLMGIQTYFSMQNHPVSYEYIPLGQRHLKLYPGEASPHIWLVDEVQRLWLGEKFRLFRTLSRRPDLRLIFSSHVDLGYWFQVMSLPLETYQTEVLSHIGLHLLLNRRLDYFRQTPSPLHFTEDGVQWLEQRYGNDRRAMERFLYEVFQCLSTPVPLDGEQLQAVGLTISLS
jgi:hypothetical protein